MRNTALFINGIYESVLDEISRCQANVPNGHTYLQPHSSRVIQKLRKHPPSETWPLRLYASTTADLSRIRFTAEIIQWEDKRSLSAGRRQQVREHLDRHQPGEVKLFLGEEGEVNDSVNLLTIRNLREIDHSYFTSILTKVSDNSTLKKRSRSGGWSEVYDMGDFDLGAIESYRAYIEQLDHEVNAARDLPDIELDRLAMNATAHPERIQVIAFEFKRSPFVIAATLRRAAGTCERCEERAPFVRRADGTPYLEVHHRTPLSKGGSDTMENTIALCPNCHRECHHG